MPSDRIEPPFNSDDPPGAPWAASFTPPRRADDPPPDDLNYDAWVLLANGAYWDHTDPKGRAEWDAARDRWRDRWHATLPEVADG